MYQYIFHLGTILFIFLVSYSGYSQADTTLTDQLGGDGYRDGQFPGLGRAASEIFYSDKKMTFSGYAEISNVLDGGNDRDISSGDLELYFNNLYRVVPFIGVRLAKRVFWNTELGFEYFEGNGESEFHFFPESYVDFIYRPWLNFRLGVQPLNIGYINNNEEPVLYLSVNRPETERIILPSQWIETGLLLYGEFNNKLNYAFGITNGVIARKFTSPTWIRSGAETQYESWNRPAFHAQLNYLPYDNLTLSISGYWNQSGRGEKILIDQEEVAVNAPLYVLSGYVRYDKSFFSVIGSAVSGNLHETNKIYYLHEQQFGEGQIIGKKTYGYYVEPSIDLIKLFNFQPSESKLFYTKDLSIPVFIRYERLDTHATFQDINGNPFVRNDLSIWMVGGNYKPNHQLALKFNVRFRENFAALPNIPDKETLFEMGLGIEF